MLMLCCSVLIASQAPAPAGVSENQPVPGPFHPLILNGTLTGRYHCPLSDFGARPFVLILMRGTDVPEGFKEMLGELDQLIGKNQAAALRGAVIFVGDKIDMPLYLANAERKAARDKIDEVLGFAMDGKPDAKNPYPSIYVGVDSSEVLKSYPMADDVGMSALLARDYRIKSVMRVPVGQLSAEKWKAMLAEVDAKLIDKTLAPVVRPRLKPRAPVPVAPAQ